MLFLLAAHLLGFSNAFQQIMVVLVSTFGVVPMKNCVSVVLLFLVLLVNQSQVFAEESCDKQVKKYRELNGKIAAAEFSQDLRERAKELQKILSQTDSSLSDASERAGKVSESIDDKKDKAEKVAERLKPVLDKLDLDVGKLTDVMDQIKAGTDRFKESLDSTQSKVSNASGLLSSAIAAADASKGSESLAALEAYFNQLNSILGPLTGSIPVVGNFLELYAHAISSAKTVAKQLEERVGRDNQTSEQELGIKVFMEFGSNEATLEQLLKQREELVAEMETTGCDDEQKKDPVENVPQEIIDACVRNAGVSADYGVKASRARSKVSDIKGDIKKLESSIEPIEFDISEAEKQAAEADNNNRAEQRFFDQTLDYAKKLYRDQPELVRNFPESIEDAAEFCRISTPASLLPEGVKICKSREAVIKVEKEGAAAKAKVLQLQRTLARAKEELDLARQSLKLAEGDSATHAEREARVKACIDRSMAITDLSGVWFRDGRSDDAFRVRLRGSGFRMLKGRNGESGLVMTATVSGKKTENKKLQNAKWKFDFGGQCPQTEQWVPFDARTWNDRQIVGTIPNLVLAEGCKVKQSEVSKTQLLMFSREPK